ncbi:MAG: hypothetical protein ACI9YR_002046, partial [Bacteroidia bacterium]
MQKAAEYPIGTPGSAWNDSDIADWLALQTVKRLLADEVIPKLDTLADDFLIERYGALTCNPTRYPLLALKSRQWDLALPNVLITGGVHGYETSGVQGAIRFAQTQAARFA